jgi:glycerol uptake facilitator protein
VLLNRSKAQNAGWIVITAAWAFAVMAGIYTARACDAPGFINPVGPLAAVINGKMQVEVALQLMAAEMLGGFVGAVFVWLHYGPHWAVTTDPGTKLAVFCTGPAIRHPLSNLVSEVIATFVLAFVGTAMFEKEIGRGFVAPMVGMLVWGIGMSLGGTTGYSLNPARDLGPRLAHAVLPIPGKGPSDWAYSWIPVVGPLIGGALGALLAREVMMVR